MCFSHIVTQHLTEAAPGSGAGLIWSIMQNTRGTHSLVNGLCLWYTGLGIEELRVLFFALWYTVGSTLERRPLNVCE